MSYLLLHADGQGTLLSDDPVVPAAEASLLSDALEVLAEAGRLRQKGREDAEGATRAGRDEGYAAGRADGRTAGEAEWRAELFRLSVQASERSRTVQDQVAKLAIEVVRHIAGEVGEERFVAALAERAAAWLVPEEQAILRVAPAACEAVRERLGARVGLTIESDPALAASDCVLETSLGRSHAGLETQLAQVQRTWDEQRNGH